MYGLRFQLYRERYANEHKRSNDIIIFFLYTYIYIYFRELIKHSCMQQNCLLVKKIYILKKKQKKSHWVTDNPFQIYLTFFEPVKLKLPKVKF